MNTKISQSELVKRFFYDPVTGHFMRLTTTGSNSQTGTVAGSLHTQGHLRIMISGQTYKAHHLAWLYMTGELPVKPIHHINGDRTDNSYFNLKLRQQIDKKN